MYICVCTGIRERDVKRALENGVRTVAEVYRFLGHTPKCGKCVPFTVAMMKEHREATGCHEALPEAAD